MWCELDAVLCGCSAGRDGPVHEKTSRQELKEEKKKKTKSKTPTVGRSCSSTCKRAARRALEDEQKESNLNYVHSSIYKTSRLPLKRVLQQNKTG